MQRFAVVMLLSAVLSGTLWAAPMMPEDDVVVRAWDFDAGTEDWQALNDLAPLTVEDGVLHTREQGPDGFMGVTDTGIDTREVSHVEIRLRAREGGDCQFYFTTDISPNPVTNGCVAFGCPPSDAFITFRHQLSDLKGWVGTLDLFRFDPVNGGPTDTPIEIDSIRLLRLSPRLVTPALRADRAWAAPGIRVNLRIAAQNQGGAFDGNIRATLRPLGGASEALIGNADIPLLWDPATRHYRGGWEVIMPEGNVARYEAEVRMDGASAAVAQTSILSAPRGALPEPGEDGTEATEFGPVLQGERLALQFVGDDAGLAGAVVRYRYPGTDTWRFLGLCQPLAEVALSLDQRQVWYTPSFAVAGHGNGRLELAAEVPEGRITCNLRLRDADGIVEMVTRFVPSRECGLMRFGGPAYRAGTGSFRNRKDMALFPGLEYLGENEPSSDSKYVGEKFGYRPSPRPNRITVPLMAVTRNGVTTGLLWDALQEWRPGWDLPMAEFASPNFLDGQANHLMALFVPNAPDFVTPNSRAAGQPCALAPGEEVVIRQRLFAEPTADVHEASAVWYREFGAPEPVKLVKPAMAFLDDCIAGWAETCYYPEADGFTSHWRFSQQPTPGPGFKAKILLHARERGHMAWAKAVGVDPAARLIDVLGSQFGGFHAGKPTPQLAAQRPDGSWLYDHTVSDKVLRMTPDLTQGDRRMLGEYGYTNVGITAFEAVNLLNYAKRTGDAECLDAGLRALKAMQGYRIPMGTSAFELHVETPDLWAAALISRCFRLGYELTQDPAFLAQAHYWLRTGLPFFYAYRIPQTGGDVMYVSVPDDPLTDGPDPHAGPHRAEWAFNHPDRQLTPYACIPVFGTTFYLVPWFGNVVQWEGLVWADEAYTLLRYLKDPLLKQVADGALASGCHQTFDKAPIRGLLPDVFAIDGNTLTGAYIGPAVLEAPLRKMLDRPDYAAGESVVLLRNGGRVHLSSRGMLRDAAWEDSQIAWTQRFPRGEICETTVVGLAAAPVALSAGQALPRVVRAADVDSGWQYDETSGLLHLRVVHSTEEMSVELRLK